MAVLDAETFDFSRAQIGLFSAGGDVSAKYAPRAAAAGCVVVDNTSQFRYEDDIPLVVPEVNAGGHRAVQAARHRRQSELLDDPDAGGAEAASTMRSGIERINVATYQSVSGAGQKAVDELAGQTAQLLNGQGDVEAKVIAKQIAFNCVPQIDEFLDNGYTKEEMKMVWETQKIFGDAAIQVNATAVRVPVFFGHSEAVHIETRRKITAAEARALLEKAPGVKVVDERKPGGYPTAVTEGANQDTVYVGRIREDISATNGDSTCGWSPTTSARAPHSTASRSPRFWSGIIYKL